MAPVRTGGLLCGGPHPRSAPVRSG